jgi:hypothetical protein
MNIVKIVVASLVFLILTACAGMGGSIHASNGSRGEQYGATLYGNTGGRQVRGQRIGYEPCAATVNTMLSAPVQELEVWANEGAVGKSERKMKVYGADSPQRTSASCNASLTAGSTSRTIDGEVVPPQRRDQRQGGQVYRADEAPRYGDER